MSHNKSPITEKMKVINKDIGKKETINYHLIVTLINNFFFT